MPSQLKAPRTSKARYATDRRSIVYAKPAKSSKDKHSLYEPKPGNPLLASASPAHAPTSMTACFAGPQACTATCHLPQAACPAGQRLSRSCRLARSKKSGDQVHRGQRLQTIQAKSGEASFAGKCPKALAARAREKHHTSPLYTCSASCGKVSCTQPAEHLRQGACCVQVPSLHTAATGSVRGGGVIWGTGRPGSKTAVSTKQCMELGKRHYDAGGICGPLFRKPQGCSSCGMVRFSNAVRLVANPNTDELPLRAPAVALLVCVGTTRLISSQSSSTNEHKATSCSEQH